MSDGGETRITVWSTQYALSNGVEKFGATECDRGMVKVINEQGYPFYLHREGVNWHRTEESAMKRAEEMRAKKIASLKNQIKKLEAMTFVTGAQLR